MSRCATTNVTARAPTRVRAPSSAIARRASARSVQTRAAQGKVLLEVKDLHAKVAETGEEILKGVNLTIREGETHAMMGKNGSGKSTLTKVLVGHPAYEVTSGSATFKGEALVRDGTRGTRASGVVFVVSVARLKSRGCRTRIS